MCIVLPTHANHVAELKNTSQKFMMYQKRMSEKSLINQNNNLAALEHLYMPCDKEEK